MVPPLCPVTVTEGLVVGALGMVHLYRKTHPIRMTGRHEVKATILKRLCSWHGRASFMHSQNSQSHL